MSRALRGLLVGAGFFAGNHLHAWAATEGATLVGVADLDGDRAEAAARAFGLPHHGRDAAKLARAISPDFVDIVAPAPSHLPLVRALAAPGRLLICQKPLAGDLAEARELVATAEAAGAALLVHENFRWQSPFRDLVAKLREGRLGRIAFALFAFRHGYDNYVNQPYLARIERFAIADVGTPLFDLAQLTCGSALSVSAQTQRRNPQVRGEDSFVAMARHVDDAQSVVEASFESRLTPHRFPQTLATVEGSEGTWELGEDYRVTLHDADGRHAYGVEPPVPRWGGKPWHVVQDSVAALLAHAVAVARGDCLPRPSGAFTLGTVALVDAAYRSAASGRACAPEATCGGAGQ